MASFILAIAGSSLLLSAVACAQTAVASKAEAKPFPAPASTDDPQLYRNSRAGFQYRIPYGWVNRTADLQEGNAPDQAEVLLAVFERPPQAAGDTINSAVVIASEKASSYPGVKLAQDYLVPLTEVVTAKGFKQEGEPGMVSIGSRQLVRADFSKPITDKLAMHQVSLIMLAKDEIISFTFLAGSEDELDSLIEALHFTSTTPPIRVK